jgi:dephospho-CoA kinase
LGSELIAAMLKIGLTGGIGSGKSTVASILAKLGAWLIDADAISRSSTQSGGVAMPALRAAFGESVVAADGSLSRDAMRQIMLSDSSAKARLESILHPLIGEQINQQLAAAEQADAQIVVLDIPLLVEGGSRWRSRLDAVWVVDCLPQTQISRVQARSGWPVAQIEAVIAAQASRDQKWAAADAVIFNEGLSLGELEQQVKALLKLAQEKADA